MQEDDRFTMAFASSEEELGTELNNQTHVGYQLVTVISRPRYIGRNADGEPVQYTQGFLTIWERHAVVPWT
jgi:hypothetical protein